MSEKDRHFHTNNFSANLIKIGLQVIIYMDESFMINPEFRILRLTFPRKSASKHCIRKIIIASPKLFSVNSKTLDQLTLIFLLYCRHKASSKF